MTLKYNPRGHRISTKGVRNLDKIVRTYTGQPETFVASVATQNAYGNVLAEAVADIEPGDEGDIILYKGSLGSPTKTVAPAEYKYKARNWTGNRIWGAANGVRGCQCALVWLGLQDGNADWGIIASDAATRIKGKFVSSNTMDEAYGLDGWHPVQAATQINFSNMFGWDLSSNSAGDPLAAEWDNHSDLWRLYQIACP